MAVVLEEEKIKNVLRQVEFYFSDSNLPRDKFLRATVEQSEDGLVSLALICSFARMRGHLGLGSLKPDEIPEETVLAVAEVLRKSSSLRVSEDGKKIGRSTELLKPEEVIEQVDSRTVAASPFPYDVKIEDVQSFFDQEGKVNSVRLPRHIGDAKAFSGTALIEFSEEDEAKSILLKKLVYAGVDLELQPKNIFDAEREKKREEFKRHRSQKDSSAGRDDFDTAREKKSEDVKGNRDGSMGSYPEGLIVAFKLTPMPVVAPAKQNNESSVKDGEVNNPVVSKSSETTEATEAIETEEKPSEDVGEREGNVNDQGNDIENEEKAAPGSSLESDVKFENNLPTEDGDGKAKTAEDVEEGVGEGSGQGNGAENVEADVDSSLKNDIEVQHDLPTEGVLRTGRSANEEGVVTREDLKKVFQNFGTVMFIDFSMGQESGYIRFEDPDAAVKARAVAVLNKEGGLVIKEKYIATLEALTGEAEKNYWSLLRANKDKHRENWNSRGRGRHHHSRGGGRDFDGKRSRDFHTGRGRPSKAAKVST